jgi:hypothetical protein
MAEAAQDAGDVSIFVEFNAPWSRFGIIATRRTRSRVVTSLRVSAHHGFPKPYHTLEYSIVYLGRYHTSTE